MTGLGAAWVTVNKRVYTTLVTVTVTVTIHLLLLYDSVTGGPLWVRHFGRHLGPLWGSLVYGRTWTI